MESGAIIDGQYRYLLTRYWAEGPSCVFIMLNPSTADHRQDDPTIRRCISFAKREGCGSLRVVNLFALRATNPKALRLVGDPIGPDNDYWIREATRASSGAVIAAWGNHGAFLGRGLDVLVDLLPAHVWCFGLTKAGAPRHPLYVRAETPLVPLRAVEVKEALAGEGE